MKKSLLRIAAAGIALASVPPIAFGQTEAPSPICTDRPTKANAPCTVPAGQWQLETDVVNATHDHRGDVTTDTLYPLNPYLKYGLGERMDIEMNWAPSVRIRSKVDGHRESTTGQGDLTVRFKARVFGSESFSAAVIPFVKAPTASTGIGNDRWEGGVAMPIGVLLPVGFSLTLGPEVDVLADADGHGRHIAFTNLVNLSHPLTSRLNIAVELWQQNNRDPAGSITQRSADVALIFAATPTFQIDAGANVGLNARTPDRQIYFGLAHRW